MIKKNKFLFLAFFPAALFSTHAMSLNSQSNDNTILIAQTSAPATAVKTSVPQFVQLPARDGSFVATLPMGWIQLPLAPNAAKSLRLSAANLSQDINAIVELENAADIADWQTWTNSNQVRLMATLVSPSSTPMQHIKVNGIDALQGEVTGIYNGARWHYLLTAFKTDKYYVFVKSWSFESEFEAHRNDLMQIPGDLHF